MLWIRSGAPLGARNITAVAMYEEMNIQVGDAISVDRVARIIENLGYARPPFAPKMALYITYRTACFSTGS